MLRRARKCATQLSSGVMPEKINEMKKKDRKRARQEAVKAERVKRQEQSREQAPFSRREMVDLMEHVARSISQKKLQDGYVYTSEWLNSQSYNVDQAIEYLRSNRIADDWELITKGNPYELFGSSDKRRAWMPLEKKEMSELIAWLDSKLNEQGCQHNHSLTNQWLRSKGIDNPAIGMALLSQGGSCDCEIVLNIEIDAIYP